MAHADELASSRVLQLAPAIAARRVAAASGHHHPHGHRHGSLQNGSLPPSRKGSGVSRLGSDGASDGFSAPSTPAAALEQVLVLPPSCTRPICSTDGQRLCWQFRQAVFGG